MKKNKPQLSVIVANYNTAPYIAECLGSIIEQTYKELEIIVYDDCSADDSPKIIKEYERKHPGIVQAIFSSVNRGVARTRHEAIKQAEGEYITTLDSDDYYFDNEKLAKEMAIIRRCKETEGKDVLAFSNIVNVKEDKSVMGRVGNGENIEEGDIFNEIITRACMIPRDFIMKRSAYFEAGGYDFKLITHEDWDLKIRLARTHEFRYTGGDGTAYRQHPTGLSSIPHYKRSNNLWRVFSKNRKSIPSGSKKRIKTAFQKFMINRDKQFINSVKRSLKGAAGFRLFKKKVWLFYNLLLNFLIKIRWRFFSKTSGKMSL
jgi:glycosyltransferase involved in cell wall biosynthesis